MTAKLTPTGADKTTLGWEYRNWLRPLAVILVSQFLFWGFLYVLERQTQPTGFELPSSVPLFLSDESGSFDLSEDPILVPYNNEPAYLHRDSSRAVSGMFLIEFEASDAQDLAFFIGWDAAFDKLTLNGQPVPVGAKDFNQTQMSGYAPGLYVLPTALLSEGRNQLGIISEGRATKFLSHYAIGSYQDLRNNYQWGQAVAYALPYASLGAGVFVLALCLIIPWARDDAIRISAFGLLLVASIVRNLQFFGLEIISDYPWVHVSHYMAVFLLVLGFPAMAIAWTGGTWRGLRILGYVYAAAIGAIVLTVPFFVNGGSFLGFQNIFFLGWQIETLLTVLAAGFVFVRLTLAARGAPPVRLAEFVIIIFCMTVILVEHLDHRLRLDVPFVPGLPIKNYFTSIVSVVLPLGLCITVSSESVRARRVLNNVNQTLETALRDKEAEIRKQAREKAVLDERRRIMRDMHDGLGAMLSGIVLQTRSKQIAYEDVPIAVQNGLDELRLIIDSLDSAGDTLAVALGAFRERAEGYLAAANIKMTWDVDPEVAAHEFAANEVLQIYRIVQEATTNIVRHSEAKNAKFSIRIVSDRVQDHLEIEVCDDGVGLSGQEGTGKGIKSMRERSRKLGGTLTLSTANPGLRVLLKVAIPTVQ